MKTNNNFPKKGIHKYVINYIQSLSGLSNKVALDIPCGDGRSSYELLNKGAKVIALDLFPEFLKLDNLKAQYADLSDTLPVDNESVDYIICQEGIEHIPNQLNVLQEFNRVLKKGGIALITTPNNSHLRARLSTFLFETDYYRRMPPTEIDSVWFTDGNSDNLYFGHLFLLSVQHFQTLLTISGFKVTKRIKTRFSSTSLILGIIYPIFALFTLLTYFSYRHKNKHIDKKVKRKILWNRVKLNLSPITLFGKDIVWEIIKTDNLKDITKKLNTMQRR